MDHSIRPIVQVVTPTGPVTLMRAVAARLLTNGVISGDLDGVLHAADAATVKAALISDGSAICDFCSAPAPQHTFEVPDFEMTAGGVVVGESTGGWAACDECAALVRAGKRRELLDRTVASLSFAKFSRSAVAELHAKFWQGREITTEVASVAQSISDYIENRVPDKDVEKPLPNTREARIAHAARTLGMSVPQIETMIGGNVDSNILTSLAKFRARMGRADRSALTDLIWGGQTKPLPYLVPHWQRALDARFEARTMIEAMLQSETTGLGDLRMDESVDLSNLNEVKLLTDRIRRIQTVRKLGFDEDAKALRHAQTYSFNAETAAAIREASLSVPHDAALSSIETPNTGAGWFWFAEPVLNEFDHDPVHGLLWEWANVDGEAAIRFGAFCVAGPHLDASVRGKIMPSAKWFWPFSMSFHDMLAYNAANYRRDYGEGDQRLIDGITVDGEEQTMRIVSHLSLFFVMACLWFRQVIPSTGRKVQSKLTTEPGHVERHARKRHMREHNLKEPPTVQVVALRKTARVAVEDAPAERQAGARQYHCRWIVRGHPRLQPCGPGRKDKKLIWIDAHPAGPDDKPLKTRERVYAVVR